MSNSPFNDIVASLRQMAQLLQYILVLALRHPRGPNGS